MKWFYPFWFILCAVWGYMAANFPDDPQFPRLAVTLKDAAIYFLQCTLAFGALIYCALRFPRKPPEVARFGIELKPWDKPLGGLQFVFVTFIFVGVWAAIFLVLGMGSRTDLAAFILTMSLGASLGGGVAARVYRRTLGAP